MLYFTGKGDKGKSEIGNKKIGKDSLIMEILGEIDELNSLIGLAKNYIDTGLNRSKRIKDRLTEIQNDLFIIQASISWFMYPKFKKPKLEKEKIEKLEREIKEIEEKIKEQKGFIIYGSNKDSAWLDYLRGVVRRVERKLVSFNKKYKLSPEILTYINRLSSYFYASARFIAYNKKIKEEKPWY